MCLLSSVLFETVAAARRVLPGLRSVKQITRECLKNYVASSERLLQTQSYADSIKRIAYFLLDET